MKKTVLLLAAALSLAACANTWKGAKHDTSRNVEKAGDAVKAGGHAVGRGLSNAGERLQEATE